jgi:hypothetical protein
MASARQMNVVLRTVLVPAARAAGFMGNLPHLLRANDSGLAVLSLQTEKRGGGLRLELGFIPAWLRTLRPRAYPGRARAGMNGPGLTAYHAPMSYRRALTRQFVRYDELAEGALPELAARLTRLFRGAGLLWLAEKERGAPLRDESPLGDAVFELSKTYDWALDWLLSTKTVRGLRESLRRAMQGSDVHAKMFAAWAFAKAGDTDAHAYLVSMLDDPGVTTRYRSDPGQSIRAAQALADLHRWRFVWGKQSVPGIKRKVAALARARR